MYSENGVKRDSRGKENIYKKCMDKEERVSMNLLTDLQNLEEPCDKLMALL